MSLGLITLSKTVSERESVNLKYLLADIKWEVRGLSAS